MLRMTMETPEERSDYGNCRLFRQEPNCEILNGEPSFIPVPGIKHQRVSLKLTSILFQKLEIKSLGIVLGAPCNVMLSPWDIVQPDILFISKTRIGIVGEQIVLGPPDLAIEILSEDSRRRDTREKRKIYADSGVREYWIVDPDAETIEPQIWCELGYISAGVFGKRRRLSSPLLPDLKLPLGKIF